MNKTDFEVVIRHEPLMMGDISRAFINWNSLLTANNPSLFLGVGLCTSKEPAVAIPFDILSFFFVAEKLRRLLNLHTVFILIADEHALTNSFMTVREVEKLRFRMLKTFTSILRNLHLRNFQLMTSSEIHADPEFQRILSTTPAMDNAYLRKEVADLTWFTRFHNVRLKLGWTINNDPRPQGHDERFFDSKIQAHHALPLTFLHIKAGRTFDQKRPKASPYISVLNESRIVLSSDSNVQEVIRLAQSTCPRDIFRATMSHLASIIRLFESLFIQLPKLTLEQKIQFIISLSTQG